MRLLLEHGASFSVHANCGPLICMAVFCNSETVKYSHPLLIPSLTLSSRAYHLIRLLLKHGVNADTKDIHGNTAMRLAVQISSDYAVRALAEYDADICFIYEGRSLLYSAVSKGYLPIPSYGSSYTSPYLPFSSSSFFVHLSHPSFHSDAEIVLTLLLHGANIAWDEDVIPTVWEMSRRDPKMKKALLHFWTPGMIVLPPSFISSFLSHFAFLFYLSSLSFVY